MKRHAERGYRGSRSLIHSIRNGLETVRGIAGKPSHIVMDAQDQVGPEDTNSYIH